MGLLGVSHSPNGRAFTTMALVYIPTENRLSRCYSNYVPLIFRRQPERKSVWFPNFQSPFTPHPHLSACQEEYHSQVAVRGEMMKKCDQITLALLIIREKCQELWVRICLCKEFLITANICGNNL